MGKKKEIPNPSEFVERKCLVSLNREPLEEELAYGFVLNFNDKFILFNYYAHAANSITGFAVFPTSSIKEIKGHIDKNSIDSLAISLNKLKPKKSPEIKIDSIQEVLKTVSEKFPLIVIHCEKKDKDICWIGKLTEIKKNSFLMLEIDTNAEWHEKPSKFKLKDITRIEFDGGYENNLALVADYRAKQSEENNQAVKS